jgi:hypothetical protein
MSFPILPLLYLGALLGSPHPSAAMRKIRHANYNPDVVGIAAPWSGHFAFSRHKSVVIIAALGCGDPRGPILLRWGRKLMRKRR